MSDVSSLALRLFLDLMYCGEVSLIRLKKDRIARRQFLDLAQAELSDLTYSLLSVRTHSEPCVS